MSLPAYHPLLRRTRGGSLESLHYGAIAVVDRQGAVRAWCGDPQASPFLRSSAKPFQVLPLLEAGGQSVFNLSLRDIALMCASHTGTDAHVEALRELQAKVGVQETDLRCGTHPPYDEATGRALLARGEEPTPIRHNCSGKHTGMLALARLRGWSTEDYLDPDHPVQLAIRRRFASMCGLKPVRVLMGTDGCSAPNFAVPLVDAASAYARLADPRDLPAPLADACRTVTRAMTAHPEMVAGPGRFDTRLMDLAGDCVFTKGGAEGYQAVGLFPGKRAPDAPALGIALKIADGDPKSRARPPVVLETLRQLGALPDETLEALAEFGPSLPVLNAREREVGRAEPIFRLEVRPDVRT